MKVGGREVTKIFPDKYPVKTFSPGGHYVDARKETKQMKGNLRSAKVLEAPRDRALERHSGKSNACTDVDFVIFAIRV